MNKYQLLMAAKKLVSDSKKIKNSCQREMKHALEAKKVEKTVARKEFLEKKEAGLRTCGKHTRFMRYKNAGNKNSVY
jgi:hypothetical protein